MECLQIEQTENKSHIPDEKLEKEIITINFGRLSSASANRNKFKILDTAVIIDSVSIDKHDITEVIQYRHYVNTITIKTLYSVNGNNYNEVISK